LTTSKASTNEVQGFCEHKDLFRKRQTFPVVFFVIYKIKEFDA